MEGIPRSSMACRSSSRICAAVVSFMAEASLSRDGTIIEIRPRFAIFCNRFVVDFPAWRDMMPIYKGGVPMRRRMLFAALALALLLTGCGDNTAADLYEEPSGGFYDGGRCAELLHRRVGGVRLVHHGHPAPGLCRHPGGGRPHLLPGGCGGPLPALRRCAGAHGQLAPLAAPAGSPSRPWRTCGPWWRRISPRRSRTGSSPSPRNTTGTLTASSTPPTPAGAATSISWAQPSRRSRRTRAAGR